ncbi:MAG: HEAT repeat domain-containing protein [Isosphaeraceae bacterium]|nr:HEAT repeat domain-containing protein [Isosphaeraceae bacterium]
MADPPELPNAPPVELPPVEPPSAGFILQLFVIPAVVVLVVILVVTLFGTLAEGKRDTNQYLQEIRSENENRRWRAATELASLIQNDEKLARDPVLLGKLTDLLAEELHRPGADPRVTEYLALALGTFQTLETASPSGQSDPLATLAEALAPERPAAVRNAAALSLSRQAARQKEGLDDPEAIAALVRAAGADDPALRQKAVYALGYCRSSSALATLRDRATEDDDRLVRYNAAVSLARHGDPAARGVLREILSTEDLAQVLQGKTSSETERRIAGAQLEALWALRDSLRADQPALARSLRADIAKLSQSRLPDVRSEADALLKNLPASP